MAQEILISINVESGEAKARVNDLKKGTDSLSKSFGVLAEQSNKNKFEQASLRGEQKLAATQQKKLNYEMQNAGKIAAVYEMSTKKASAGTKQFRTQVGLNNAILQEAGRAASDLRFGFNGVANNVGQLASLFGSLINTSDNVGTSLRNLANSLLGTGGILIGVQLLIAYGDKIFAFFSGSAKEASKFQKSIDEATESIDKQIKSFERLTGAVQKYGNIGKLGADANMLLADSASMFAKALDAIEEGAILTIREGFDKTFDPERTLKGAEAADELRVKFGELLNIRREIAIVEARLNAVNEDGQKIIQEGSQGFVTATSKFLQLTRRKIEIEQLFNLEVDKGSKGRSKSLRIANREYFNSYELRLKDFDRYAEKALKKEETFLKKSEIQNLDIRKKQAIRELDLAARNETEREKVRYQAYIESVELRKQNLLDQINSKESELLLEAKTEEEKQDIRNKASLRRSDILNQFVLVATEANKRYSQSLDEIKNSFADATMSIIDSYGNMQDIIVEQQILDDLSAFGLEAIKGIQDRLKAQRSASEERSEQLMIEQALLDSQYEFERNALDQKISLAEAEGEAYEALIQKKKNLDASYAEETAAINLETDRVVLASKLSVFTETANMLDAAAALAKEGSDLAKGLALTALATNTAVSMIQGFRLAQEASQGTGPAAPFIAAATYIQQITTLLSAVSRAKNILSSGKTDGVSASAASAPVQAPNFNVVGTSSVDQLAQTVAGQTNEPIKAYVVGKDVTNQQELDRNIVNTAGI